MDYSNKFGLKNIYYCGNDFTEINLKESIISNGFKEFSPKGISSYFTFRYPIPEFTMFEDYSRLDSCNTVLKDNLKYTYWRPRFSYLDISEAEAIAKTKNLLIKSIEGLVKNKQIIGLTLSGGLDSSLLLALCRSMYPGRKIYTYSCGFYGDDEFEYSRRVAKLFSDKHEEIVLGKDDFIGPKSIIPSLIKHKCAPLHPNETALAYAEIKAKQDLCDIVMCGEGADDIFGGYGYNLRMYMTYEGEPKGFFNYVIKNYRYFSSEERDRLLQPHFCVNVENEANVLSEIDCPAAMEDKMFYFIQRLHTRGLIERGMNALSYNNFCDGFPFICDELVDFVNSLPFDFKIRMKTALTPEQIKGLSYTDISEQYDEPKYLLKKIAEEFLENDIIYRKKKGFPVPFGLWFVEDKTWDLDKNIFKTNDISGLSGWKKFMIINLDYFIKIFSQYRQ